MAKQFWEDDAPAASGKASSENNFWEGDADAAKQDLPKGVTPSTAGGGRGSVNPPRIAAAMTDEELSRPAGAMGRTIERKPADKRSLLERSVEGATEGERASLIRQERRANWEQDQINLRSPSATGTTAPKEDVAANRGAEFATTPVGQNPVGRAVAKAVTGLAQGSGGLVQAVGDFTGIEPVANVGKATAEGAEAFEKGMGKGGPIEGFGPRSPVPYLTSMGEGAASSLGQSAALASMFGPRGVIAAQSIIQGGQSYNEARQAGLDPATALARAVPQGAFEAIGEKFQGLDKLTGAMGTLLQKGASADAKRTAADVLVKAGIREIPGEVLTYLGQTGTDLIPGIGLNPNLTMSQFLDGLADTVVQSAMMGGATAGAGHAAGGRMNRQPQQPGAGTGAPTGPAPLDATQPPAAPQNAAQGAIPASAAAVSSVPSAPAPQANAAQLASSPVSPQNSPVPTPEPPADIAAQIDAIRDPSSGKTSALITPNSPAANIDLTGLHAVQTNLGTFVTSDIDTAREVAARRDSLTDDEMGQLLGYTTPKGASDGTVVQALDRQGNVVHEEATNAQALPLAATQAAAMVPEGGTLRQTDALAAQAERQERMPGALTRAAMAAGSITPDGRPTAMNDPKARPKTFAEQQSAMEAVAALEAKQEADAAFEAAMLADESLPDITEKGAQDAPAKSPTPAPAPAKEAAAPRKKTTQRPGAAADAAPAGQGRVAEGVASGSSTENGRSSKGSGLNDEGGSQSRPPAPSAARAPDRVEPAADATSTESRATYPTLAAATSYIRKQRALGTNITAAPYTHADGSITVAIKGTPEYERALDQRQERLKGEANAGSTGRVSAPPADRRRAGRDTATGGMDAGRGAAPAADRAVPAAPAASRAESVVPAAGDSGNGALIDPATGKPTASWIIRDKATGEAVMETFDRKKVDALNTKKYEAVPAGQHLIETNAKIKATASTAPEHAGVDATGPKTKQFTSEALKTARTQVQDAAKEWDAFAAEHADQLEGKNKKRKPKADAPQAVKDRFEAYVRMRDAASDAYNAALKAEKLGVAAGQPRTTKADVIDGRVPMTIDAENFKVVTDEFASLFADPEAHETVRMSDQTKGEMLTPEQAKARVAEWEAHAQQQGRENRSENSRRTVLSLFDLTGEWSKPWEEAGYNVLRFDIQSGQDVFDFSVEYFTDNYDLSDVYAILAATPCTDFASSGSKHFLAKDAAGQTEQSVKLVHQTAATIEYFRPPVWALENPVGRIQNLTGLPDPRLSFDPNHFGDPYTKKTLIWGNFNAELPGAPVEPTEGSKMHSQYGGKSIETKNARSETPEGFAYAFFMANNYIDRPASQKLAAEYPEASGAVTEALKAGVPEARIHELMEDTYGNYEYDEARTVLAEEVARMREAATATSTDAAAHEAATSPHNDKPEPTTAQKKAGNYAMGHLSGEQTQGIDITIENPKDSTRSGIAPDGTAWSNNMGAHYGYAKRSEAADGDHVDVFVGPAADRAPTVYVIDQVNADGSYDEAKAMFGFMNKAAALKAYRSSYSKGWKVGPVTAMPVSEFKEGLASGRFKNPLDATLAAQSATKPAQSETPTPKSATETATTAATATPKAKRETKAQREVREKEEARAKYFTPGNVVRAYGSTFDRVISYTAPTEPNGPWSVTVQRVQRVGPSRFEDVPGEVPRTHATQPDASALRVGPAARMATPKAPEANGSSFGELYHGTPLPFDQFDASRLGKMGSGEDHQGRAIYLTSDRTGYGRFFARNATMKRSNQDKSLTQEQRDALADSDGVVLNVRLSPDAKILDIRGSGVDAETKRLFDASKTSKAEGEKLRAHVQAMGYDGIAFGEPTMVDGWEHDPKATTVAVYNPEAARITGNEAPAKEFIPGDREARGANETEVAFSIASDTSTAAFKKWFGESKVVDSSGAPLVVYHGTPAAGLRIFDDSKIGANGRAEGAGFYFTTDKQVADAYGQRGETLQVYLSIKKPLHYDAKPFTQAQMQKVLAAVAKVEEQDTGTDWRDGFLSNYVYTYSKPLDTVVREAARSFNGDETALDQISGIVSSGVDATTVNTGLTNALGYDGYFSKGFSGEGKGGGDIWVAMKSEQVKSATDNTGAFDAKNPDIRMRTGEGVGPAVKTKPASTEHEVKAQRLLKNLQASQESYLSFQAVEPDENSDAGKMLAAVRLTAKRMFGHDVVFVRFNGPAAFNGAMSTSMPDTVFVRVDSSKPHMAILGHELLHSLRASNPALYAAMENRLNQLTNDQTTGFYRELKAKYEAMGRKAPEGSKLREELYADIVGDHFLSPEFWNGMAADQRGLFRRVADAIVRFLDRVIGMLANSNALGTREMLKDAEEARRVVIAGMRAFSDQARARSGLPVLRGADSLAATSRKPAGAVEFTRDSKVKHVVYHATNADFNVFDTSKSDLGAHFGTVEQANKVAATRLFGRTPGAVPNVMPVYINLRSPLRLKDVGTFHADGIAPQLAAKGWMTKAEAKAIVSAIDRDWSLREKYDKQMRELIEEQGYDGVVYKNTHEGDGDSYIVFHPEQIKSATGNQGTFDKNNPDIRMSAERGAESLTDLSARLEKENPGLKLDLAGGSEGDITLSRIVVPERGAGTGTKVMQEIIDYADANGRRIVLTPSSDFGGNKGRLIRFYRGLGFVDNKGQKKDFSTRETMYREPSSDVRFSAAAPAPAAPKKPNPALTRAIFGGSMEYMRDQNGKPVKVADQVAKYKAIDTDERGQMLLRKAYITADQLKRWKESPLDVYDGAINNRFKKHFEAPGIVWRDDELRNIFKLDDEGIAMYRALRAQADESITRNAVAAMLRLAGADGHAVRDQVLAEPMDVAAITLRDHLLALASADRSRNKLLTDRANAVIDQLDQANDDMNNGMVPDDMKAEARPNPWESTTPTVADRIIYELQDGRIDLKRTQEAIERSGAKIREDFDARLAETLYSGRMAKRTQAFLESEAKPLLQSMALQGIGQVELGDYLHARAAPERNAQIAKVNPDMPDGGAGANSQGLLLTTAAARKYIADIPADRRAKLEALAQRVDAITKGTRSLLVSEGLEKADTIKAWEAVYKTYVPMFREDVEFSRMTVHKRATGSEKKAVNILANVLLQREAAITRAEKNRVRVSLYGLALTNPNPKFWTTIRPETDRAQIAEDLKNMGIDAVDAEAGMARPPTVTTVDPVTNLVVERLDQFYRDLPTAINLKINGEHRILLLNKDDPRALRMAMALQGSDNLTQFDLAGSLIGRTTRWLAAVNTQYNPVFGVVNFMRDTMGGVIHLGNTELRGSSLKVVGGLPGALKGIAAHLAGKHDSGKWSRLFEQFQQDGGQTGFREMFEDGARRAEAVERDLKKMSQSRADPRRIARGMMSLLSGFNEVTENAVRLSAYAAALDKGMSRPEAARLARELTVDFNRKGRATREIGPLYAFFNAAVQGNERTIRALRGPTGKYIISGGLALGIAQALMIAAAGIDDDEIPDYVKARALIIPLFGKDKKYILIPLPLGLNVIPNTGRVITEMVLGDGKNLGKKAFDAVGEIAGAVSPLGGGNPFTADGALRTIAPTVVDPLIELGFNKNFAGQQIERDPRGESDVRPGYQRARESTQKRATGQAYLGISKAMNWATGGTDYEAGAVSPTPERIRYVAQVALGGVLRESEKIIDTSVAAARGEKVTANNIPVASRFYGKVDEGRVEQSRYFNNKRTLEKLRNAEKGAMKAGNEEGLAKLRANPLHSVLKPAAKIDKSIQELNKMAVQVIGNPEEQQAIDEKRTQVMKNLNDGIKAIEQSQRSPTLGERLAPATP